MFFLVFQIRFLMKSHAFVRENFPKVLNFKKEGNTQIFLNCYIYWLCRSTVTLNICQSKTSDMKNLKIINTSIFCKTFEICEPLLTVKHYIGQSSHKFTIHINTNN